MFSGLPRSPRGGRTVGVYSQMGNYQGYGGDDGRRYDQAQLADEIRQELQAKTQGRGFMSNISAMMGNGSDQIEQKRKRQEELIRSLNQQIHEKRKRIEAEKAREATMEYYKPVTMETIADTAARMLDGMQPTFAQTTKPEKPPPPVKVQAPPELMVKAETLPRRPIKPMVFQVSTESPFDHSSVVTPPLGFSLRRSVPTRNAFFAQDTNRRDPDERGQPRQRLLNGTNRNMKDAGPEPRNGRTRLLDDSRWEHRGHGQGDSDYSAPRLGTNSELIYPDGHISAISSPR